MITAAIAVLTCFYLTCGATISSELPSNEGRLTCYVSPDPNQQPCPDKPCETLSNYVRNTSLHHCLGSGATMHFLSGSHILLDPIIIENVTDLTFTGEHNATSSHWDFVPVSKIDCLQSDPAHSGSSDFHLSVSMGALIVSNLTNLTVNYLAFLGCGRYKNKGCGPHAALCLT